MTQDKFIYVRTKSEATNFDAKIREYIVGQKVRLETTDFDAREVHICWDKK